MSIYRLLGVWRRGWPLVMALMSPTFLYSFWAVIIIVIQLLSSLPIHSAPSIQKKKKKNTVSSIFSNNGFWPATHWLGLTHASRPMSKFVRLFLKNNLLLQAQ
jgi:hypothetical protein